MTPRAFPHQVHYVYLLRSSRHFYVGVRSCAGDPADDHYMGSGTALKVARASGERFAKTILCVCDTRAEVFELEEALVGLEQIADRACLNLVGGGRGRGVGDTRTAEHKEAMRLANLGNQRRKGTTGSARQRAAVAASNKRRLGVKLAPKLTAEQRAEMSRRTTARNKTRRGKKRSPEHVAAMQEGLLRYWERRRNEN